MRTARCSGRLGVGGCLPGGSGQGMSARGRRHTFPQLLLRTVTMTMCSITEIYLREQYLQFSDELFYIYCVQFGWIDTIYHEVISHFVAGTWCRAPAGTHSKPITLGFICRVGYPRQLLKICWSSSWKSKVWAGQTWRLHGYVQTVAVLGMRYNLPIAWKGASN